MKPICLASHHADFRRAALLVLLAVGTAATLAAAPARAHDPDQLQVSTLYKIYPTVGGAPRARSANGNEQPGERWSGEALPDTLNVGLFPSVHEFDVLTGYNNGSLSVTIQWSDDPALAYDLDLYVDRLGGDGNWVQVVGSTNGQLNGAGDPMEIATVLQPQAGHYRARVVNWASTQTRYTGELVFAPGTKAKLKLPRNRSLTDRPDLTGAPTMHLIYMVPSNGVDEQLDINGVLEQAASVTNAWFAAQAGGRTLRLDKYVPARSLIAVPDISFVRGEKTAEDYQADSEGVFTAITNELERRGWNAAADSKRYLVYYAGPAESLGICGTAYASYGGLASPVPVPPDSPLPQYAQWSVVFLDAAAGCGAREFGDATGGGRSEAIAVQEMMHNEGITNVGSLHHCASNPAHICTGLVGAALYAELYPDFPDPEDIDALFPYVTHPLGQKVLDGGHDDYFQHPFSHYDFENSIFLAQPGE